MNRRQATASRIATLSILAAFAPALALPRTQLAAARAEPAWTTYHRDPARSGADPDAVGPVAPALDWQSPDLGAPIWSQPLVLGERVYVATVGDRLYALQASTGQVAWQKSAGTPVPAGELPCGDISPTVGIVGTPVIDAATQTIYAVADTWNASTHEAAHMLEGFNTSDGEQVLSVPVDPPESDHRALLQRTALNLDGGNVLFGYGGNWGDCGDYRGAVAAVPQAGGIPRFWQVPIAPPSQSGGAVWAPSGPAVDGEGNVYASTGNPDPPPGQEATTFDYSDSVVKLGLEQDFVADPLAEPVAPLATFEPPNWLEESNNDLDLSSTGPQLLPGGLLFQAGKDGVGYLIDQASMKAVFHEQVCAGSGSFGGDAYAAGVIYVACRNGTQALAYDQSARTFTPLWQGPVDASGPPILSGGLVWTVATGGFNGGGTVLYGLDTSGQPRYVETLPSPVADHFASPSAAGSRVFVATGSTVTAYALTPVSSAVSSGAPAPPGSNEASPAITAVIRTAPVTLLRSRLLAKANGRVRLALKCLTARPCRGTVTLRAKLTVPGAKAGAKAHRVVLITLVRARFGPHKGRFAVSLKLSVSAEQLLRRHRRLVLQVLIGSPGSRTRRATATLTQAP